MTHNHLIGPFVRRFLLEELVADLLARSQDVLCVGDGSVPPDFPDRVLDGLRDTLNVRGVPVTEVVLGIVAAIIASWFSRRREYRADAGGAGPALGRRQLHSRYRH